MIIDSMIWKTVYKSVVIQLMSYPMGMGMGSLRGAVEPMAMGCLGGELLTNRVFQRKTMDRVN